MIQVFKHVLKHLAEGTKMTDLLCKPLALLLHTYIDISECRQGGVWPELWKANAQITI